MRIVNWILSLLLMSGGLAGCGWFADEAKIDIATIEQAQIDNLQAQGVGQFSSGQPSKMQFETLKAAGIKHVINLRTPDELEWDEAAWVGSLGMQYHQIPVDGPRGITSENARQLHQLMTSLEGEPVLVHCSSSNRVGGLVTLIRAEIQGQDVETAIAEGKRWGMTRLEPLLRETLAQK